MPQYLNLLKNENTSRNLRKSLFSFLRSSLFLLTNLLFTQILCANAHFDANSILVLQEGESRFDYLAQKKAHRELVGYDDLQIRALNNAELNEVLRQSFIQAQRDFLSATTTANMSSSWRDVTLYAYKADWAKTEREIIFFAFMRLAQLARSSSETRRYVQAAIEFDAEVLPDAKVFPPPLIDLHKSILKSMGQTRIDTRTLAEYTYLVINGVVHDLTITNTINVYGGTKRMTYISPAYLPVTRILKVDDIQNFIPDQTRPDSKSLTAAQGKAQITGRLPAHTHAQITAPPIEMPTGINGVRGTSTGINTETETNTNTNTNTDTDTDTDTSTNTDTGAGAGQYYSYNSEITSHPRPTTPSIEQSLPQAEKKSWMSNYKLWVGIGLVAGAIYAIQQNENDRGSDNSSPQKRSHKEGL